VTGWWVVVGIIVVVVDDEGAVDGTEMVVV
jgi:hypothetical protein